MRLALALCLIATSALALDRPRIPPGVDAAVTYRTEGAADTVIPGGAGRGPIRLFWSAATKRLRLEAEGRPQYLLLDIPGVEAHLLDTGLRSAVTLPIKEREIDAILLTGAAMTRRGDARIAGLACTDWAVHPPRGEGTVCLTPNGVPLRAEGTIDGKHGAFVATAADLAPQRADLFRVPAGWMSFNFPSFAKPPK